MILPLRFLQVVAIFMVPLLCAAPALGVLNEESDEDVLLGPVAAEVPGPESYESLLRDMMEKIEQGIEAKKHLIRIEALTLCPTEDIRDRLEQQQEDEREDLRIPSRGRHLKWRWCEDTPKLVYPSGAVPHWDFDALYTMNWTNVDDGCPQVFRWTTKKCGQLNKTLDQGQRSMQFVFRELAAEFPKEQCDYTLNEFFAWANSSKHSLRVDQPLNPHTTGYWRGIALRPNDQWETTRRL